MSASRTSASAARAVWTAEMIACLLELRLGLLLPLFSRSRAPAQLQDAWKQLHDEFALETGADVSVPQLKNKYQQLKREYEEAQRRLQRRRLSGQAGTAAAEGDGSGDEGGDADDSTSNADAADPALPPYWRTVKAAFSGADGRDGVSFFCRPKKKYGARVDGDGGDGGDGSDGAARDTPTASNADQVSTASENDDETPVSRRDNSSNATTAAFTPATSGDAAAPRTATSDAGPARGSVAYPQVVIPRRLSFPSAQQAPRISNSSSSSSNGTSSSNGSSSHIDSSSSVPRAEADARPRSSGVKRPLPREDQQSAPPTQATDDPPTTTTTATQVARTEGDSTIAQAILAAGERIARAMVESARILAGAPHSASSTTSSPPATEAARYEDIAAKQDAHERMLEALAQSAKSSEALLRTLAESALRRQDRRS